MRARVVLSAAFGDGSHLQGCRAAARAAGGRLHYLALAPQLGPAPADDALRAQWPAPLPGWHRLELDGGAVTLDLLVGAAAELGQVEARVDAFHLPAGAALPPARALARLAAPGATVWAGAPGEAYAWDLRNAGFDCQLLAGAARDDLAGVYAGRQPSAAPGLPAEPQRQAIVIGAGMAGTAACERLCARGWQVTLIERHAEPAQEASGNVAGIFMPLLSKDDNIPTRLSRAAFLYALRHFERLGGVGQAFHGAACGVLQLARDAGHARVQQAVLAAHDYPPDFARWLDAEAAGALLGGATPHGGWLFGQGGWANPASLCRAALDACGTRLRRRFCAEALRLERADGLWQVRAAGGELLASAPTVILANGTGARALAQTAGLPLAALRGQVTHLDPARLPALPLVVCREAYVTQAHAGVICAGATYDDDGETALRLASQQENLARLAEIVPGADLEQVPLAGRVGFRCAAPDRLPLVGALPDEAAAGRLERLRDVPRHAGLYGLLGYASRGLIWGPLMAELLACQLEGSPAPLEATLVAALDPGRFLLKQRRRSQ